MARILAIESDPERIVILRRLVSGKLDADVIVADSVQSALTALEEKRPDVILTSSFLRPCDDQRLVDHLRKAPALDHLPVLTLPPLVDTDDESPDRLVSRIFLSRSRQSPPAYDVDAVASRIEDALEQSKRDAAKHELLSPARQLLLESAVQEENSLVHILDDDLARFLGIHPQQDRAPRWTRGDLSWLESIRLTWGAELDLLNMSSSGLLVESGVRMTLGNLTDFELADRDDRDYVMAARIVRSDVASVTGLGVKYVTAAVFDKPFEAIGPNGSMPPQRAYRRSRRW
jgi:hypothetical protein